MKKLEWARMSPDDLLEYLVLWQQSYNSTLVVKVNLCTCTLMNENVKQNSNWNFVILLPHVAACKLICK